MSRSLAGFVNLRELAGQESAIEAKLALSDLERVAGLVSGEAGAPISLRLAVRQDHDLVLLDGKVDGAVRLICQRCMEVMDLALSGPLRLALSETEGEIEGVPGGFELVCLPEAEGLGETLERVNLLPLVEDELLLRIPLVPMHGEGTECESGARARTTGSRQATREEETTRPFSALAELMADKGKGH